MKFSMIQFLVLIGKLTNFTKCFVVNIDKACEAFSKELSGK